MPCKGPEEPCKWWVAEPKGFLVVDGEEKGEEGRERKGEGEEKEKRGRGGEGRERKGEGEEKEKKRGRGGERGRRRRRERERERGGRRRRRRERAREEEREREKGRSCHHQLVLKAFSYTIHSVSRKPLPKKSYQVCEFSPLHTLWGTRPSPFYHQTIGDQNCMIGNLATNALPQLCDQFLLYYIIGHVHIPVVTCNYTLYTT